MKEIFDDADDLDGFEDLKDEDQEKIRKAWEDGKVDPADIPESAKKPEEDEDEDDKMNGGEPSELQRQDTIPTDDSVPHIPTITEASTPLEDENEQDEEAEDEDEDDEEDEEGEEEFETSRKKGKGKVKEQGKRVRL